MEDVERFREEFQNTVAIRAASDQTFLHTALVEQVAELLGEAGELSDAEIGYFRGSGSRNRSSGIDGYAFDQADASLRVLIAADAAEDAGTFTATEARALFSRAATFVEDGLSGRALSAIEPSLPAWSFANEIHRLRESISRIRIYVVTDRLLSSRASDWPEAAIAGIPAEAHIWDIARFGRLAQSSDGRDELNVDFAALVPRGIPCLRIAAHSDDYQAYLLAIPGTVLADVYDQYGSRLLEGNVRSFLSLRPAVNKGIRNTALNEPEMFFAYNNGIAATATDVVFRTEPDGISLISAIDLQIVNGGQTTATLAAARRNDRISLDHVMVPMKLSVVDADKAASMIPNIAKYANSQNRISEADFFSNHEYQRRLEEISRRIWAPAKAGSQIETHWFYERARGQYQNEQASLTPAQKRRFLQASPKDQMFTKTDLAKSEMAWFGRPNIASLGAQKNFSKFAELVSSEWDDDDLQFNESYFKNVVAHLIVFRHVEQLVLRQPWYQGGYRANVVYYSLARLAVLAKELRHGESLDLDGIWRAQTVSETLSRQLTVVAKAMHEVLTSPPSHVQNVTEWAKREQCWDKAKAARIEVLPGFAGTLVDSKRIREAEFEARKTEKLDKGIGAQSTVAKLGFSYWEQLRSWSGSRGLLLQDEDVLLRLAAGKGGFPTEKQSYRLLALKARLEGEGFPIAQ